MLDPRMREEIQKLLGERASFDEPLAKHTSLRVGGPAEAMAWPGTREELRALLELCRAHEVSTWMLGAGFNSIAADVGVPGVVVRLQSFRSVWRDGETGVQAEAGAAHASVTHFCASEGLTGLEFAVGIPGTVGGWLAMNAGIGAREMKDVVKSIEFLDLATGSLHEMTAEQLRFRYRALEVPAEAVLLGAHFATEPGDPQEIRARMRAHMTERRETQPVDQLSCGSVFKNPPGDAAGRLIEAAGLKGERSGGAEISMVHANFIVNRGGASAADVCRLIDRAREEVSRQFDLELEPEVRVLGGNL